MLQQKLTFLPLFAPELNIVCPGPDLSNNFPVHQEADRKILAVLLEGEVEDQRLEKARKERAVADAAWMKRVIEEQLHLEREREAEFDILYR